MRVQRTWIHTRPPLGPGPKAERYIARCSRRWGNKNLPPRQGRVGAAAAHLVRCRRVSNGKDIIDRIIGYHNRPGKQRTASIMLECKIEIERLRAELAKEMRETFWLKREVERLHALLKEARRDF